ncbi:MAG: hypothetical protein PHR39_04565 [Actinomycetota bacterium]|nr:hypothetical protein [Actinomycetota bacterium]
MKNFLKFFLIFSTVIFLISLSFVNTNASVDEEIEKLSKKT